MDALITVTARFEKLLFEPNKFWINAASGIVRFEIEAFDAVRLMIDAFEETLDCTQTLDR